MVTGTAGATATRGARWARKPEGHDSSSSCARKFANDQARKTVVALNPQAEAGSDSKQRVKAHSYERGLRSRRRNFRRDTRLSSTFRPSK